MTRQTTAPVAPNQPRYPVRGATLIVVTDDHVPDGWWIWFEDAALRLAVIVFLAMLAGLFICAVVAVSMIWTPRRSIPSTTWTPRPSTDQPLNSHIPAPVVHQPDRGFCDLVNSTHDLSGMSKIFAVRAFVKRSIWISISVHCSNIHSVDLRNTNPDTSFIIMVKFVDSKGCSRRSMKSCTCVVVTSEYQCPRMSEHEACDSLDLANPPPRCWPLTTVLCDDMAAHDPYSVHSRGEPHAALLAKLFGPADKILYDEGCVQRDMCHPF